MMIPSDTGVNGLLIDRLAPLGSGMPKSRVATLYEQEQDAALPCGGRGGKRHGNMQPLALGIRVLPFVLCLLILITLPHPTLAVYHSQPRDLLSPGIRASNPSSPLLECLQVSPPVLSLPPTCQQTLMVHTFGWSYGRPFVGAYDPPDCAFNRLTFHFTVTSAGRQFDRLALMFLNDTEVFRTSTAEPKQNGIAWTYVKDMSNFVSLFREPQKIIFDLGSLVDDTYTGSWNTTLTATFFTADDAIDAADLIIPVSARKSASDSPSGFVVPGSKASNDLVLPQNANKAVFSISACGQATEEFWWSNVLSSDARVFGNDTVLYGYSPFRELQLYIDGTLAGFAWPFPVIFTGGVVPALWRPVVGIDAFDLREDEIDITPFLSVLSDGGEHSFEIRVVGIEDDGKGHGLLTDQIGSNWIVTGKVFVWLDSGDGPTKGTPPTVTASEPTLLLHSSVQTSLNGSVTTLDYSVRVARSLSISSTIETSAGSRAVTWTQDFQYSNRGQVSHGGNDQFTKQTTSGTDVSSENYSKAFEYPLCVSSSYKVLSGGNFSIEADIERAKYVQQIGDLAFPSPVQTFDFSHGPSSHARFSGASSDNWQNGSASYLSVPAQKMSYGSGRMDQLYSLTGIADAVAVVQGGTHDTAGQGNAGLYRRHVVAANDSIITDEESFGGQAAEDAWPYPTHSTGTQTFVECDIKALLGRGPS